MTSIPVLVVDAGMLRDRWIRGNWKRPCDTQLVTVGSHYVEAKEH